MHTKTSTSIISFDSFDITELDNLRYSTDAVAHCIENKDNFILVCGAYNDTHKKLLSLATRACKNSKQNIIPQLTTIKSTHKKALAAIFVDNTNAHYQMFLKKIEEQYGQVMSLFKGIQFVKEVSNRTEELLHAYASRLSAILFHANIFVSHAIEPHVAYESNNIKFTSKSKYYIFPTKSYNHSQDYTIAELAKQFHAVRVLLWTKAKGVMTADPNKVPTSKTIPSIDYNSAIEIAYLGGKILHPTAIQLLMKHHIPIHIYSMNNSRSPATIISTDTAFLNKKRCVAITLRDNFTLLSVRSTLMYNTYGYLEQIFKTFNHHQVPIETLSSSEVSISVTFKSKHFSRDLLRTLQNIGTIEYTKEQSIICLVGTRYWKTPNHIGAVFSALPDTHTINMVSLGRSGENLNLIVDTNKSESILLTLYNHFFP